MEQAYDLLIIDDVFPWEHSPFREEEFSQLLDRVNNSYLLVVREKETIDRAQWDNDELALNWIKQHKGLEKRILTWEDSTALEQMNFNLAYAVFLNNIYDKVEWLEQHKIPFAFTLYPGGGFALDNPESDDKLRRVLESPYFRRVIVTQDISQEYLLRKGFCDESRITNIFGVVIPKQDLLTPVLVEHPMEKEKLVLTFCAYKYAPRGLDKGYDIFIETAKRLHSRFPGFSFCVIGNFDEHDIDVSELGDSIHFYGVLDQAALKTVFSKTDIIVAPNRINVLGPGFFDGFPTASCITAALSGALIMTTDELGLNRGRFASGENIEILPCDVESFYQRLIHYHYNRKKLMSVKRKQMDKVLSIYGTKKQIDLRVEVLQKEIRRSREVGQMENRAHEDNTIVPVMHCFDNNYVIPAAASFYSMLKHADNRYHYILYVLHTDITVQNQDMLRRVVSRFKNATLEFIYMADRFQEIWKKLTFSGHFSKEVLYKLLVPSIFTQHDKIIITDVDVVFCGDIAPSYFALSKDEPVCFAGVRHICPRNTWLDSYYENYTRHFGKGSRDELKVCGGYLVANLHYMRQCNKETQFLDYLAKNAYRLLQSEQDVINFCCQESEIKYLPLNNVVCSYMYEMFDKDEWPEDPFYSNVEIRDAMENPIQLHYATGVKPWKDPLSTKADLWVQYLAESGEYLRYLKKQWSIQQPSPERVERSDVGPKWNENDSPMVVSVLCCTYNHEMFIRDTLDGIVSQKLDVPFEVIVSDDASTDGTQEIIQEYAERYPELIRPVLRKKNVGIGENYYSALSQVRGKFLAICDGDDQWVDTQKLQKQVDYLNVHPECNVCCTSFTRREHQGEEYRDVPFYVDEYIANASEIKSGYTLYDFLYCRFVASCTTMFRWQFLNRVPEFIRYYRTIDFPLCLLHAASGTIGVINDYLPAIYNVHIDGITSSSSYNMQQESFRVLNEVDQYLEYRFAQTISDFITYAKTGKKPTRASIPTAGGDVGPTSLPVMSASTEKTGFSLRESGAKVKWKCYVALRAFYLKYLPSSVHIAWRKVKSKFKK